MVPEIAHLLKEGGKRITPSQTRAARQLLGIKASDLAEMSGVALPTIKGFEQSRSVPREATVRDIRQALEAKGVVFNAAIADATLTVSVSISRPIEIS